MATFPKKLLTEKKKIDFYKLGQDIALGKKGTGWMAVNEGELEEAKEAEGDTKIDKFRNWAEGWKETEQWQYEVGRNMAPLTDKTLEKRLEQEDEYFWGYVKAMELKEKQLKKKLKDVV